MFKITQNLDTEYTKILDRVSKVLYNTVVFIGWE